MARTQQINLECRKTIVMTFDNYCNKKGVRDVKHEKELKYKF